MHKIGHLHFVLFEIYKAKLFGAKYVWILPGWYPDGWWQDVYGVSCSNDEMVSVLDLYLGFSADDGVSDVSLINFKGLVSILGAIYQPELKTLSNFLSNHSGLLKASSYKWESKFQSEIVTSARLFTPQIRKK